MTVSQTGLGLIKKHEGLRLSAYQDIGGIWTIGYGHTKTAAPGKKITQAQAEALLKSDLKSAESDVLKLVKVPLKQNEFDALVSLVFNIGGTLFSTSTILRLLNQGNKSAAVNEFGKWVNVKGKRVQGLVNRRNDEAELFKGTGGTIILAVVLVSLLVVFFK